MYMCGYNADCLNMLLWKKYEAKTLQTPDFSMAVGHLFNRVFPNFGGRWSVTIDGGKNSTRKGNFDTNNDRT